MYYFKMFARRVFVCSRKFISNYGKNYSTEGGIVRAKTPFLDIPNEQADELILHEIEKFNTKIAVECAVTGRRYSYLDIKNKTIALANFLHKYPYLKQGDTVAVVLPNVPEYPIIFLGVPQAGLILTTVNPGYTSEEIAKQLRDSSAKMVFTLNDYHNKVVQATQDSKIPIVTINHENNDTPNGAIKFSEIIEGDNKLAFRISRSFDDTFVLPYSSGTTGLPKGVELTNKNIVATIQQTQAEEICRSFSEGEVTPAILPMFHIYGMTVIMVAMLLRGCKMITMPKFDPNVFIDVLERHKPTFSFLVPPLVLFMSNHPGVKPEHVSRMHTIFSGAAPLGASDIEKLQKKAGGVDIMQGYGLTETSPMITAQTTMLPDGVKPGGSGLLVRNTEVKMVSVDDENKILGPNETGELVVRGPQVMKGYFNNPKSTQEVLDKDGWFRTGDIGYYDDSEHFFITDRLKELIKVKGLQVAPAELEELVRSHPQVEDAAVVGIPHDTYGEVPKAFVIAKKGTALNSETVQDFVAKKLSKHKHLIGGVVLVDSIPKSVSGKILRRQLKNM